MKEILELLKKYGKTINDDLVKVTIFSDGSGRVLTRKDPELFNFRTIAELKKELKERTKE